MMSAVPMIEAMALTKTRQFVTLFFAKLAMSPAGTTEPFCGPMVDAPSERLCRLSCCVSLDSCRPRTKAFAPTFKFGQGC